MRVAVVVFPGSAADDCVRAYSKYLGQEAYTIWHQEEDLKKPDIVVLPGGAAFGDYLRPGALTRGSPIIGPVTKFARDGGPLIGIGNGFQILCENELLPGTLLINSSMEFVSDNVHISVANNVSPFCKGLEEEEILELPVACKYGRYYADKRTLKDLEEGGHVAFRFCSAEGDIDFEEPYNDCSNCIAAITSRHDNVLGIVAHPERAVEKLMGSEDGLKILGAVL